jgi:integrase
MKNIVYNSKLGSYITAFIIEKQICGYCYKYEAISLKSFDAFIISSGNDTGFISKEMIDEWSIQRPTESINFRNQRISIVRQFCKYILSLGGQAYISPSTHDTPTPDPYVLTDDELQLLFKQIDSFVPLQKCYKYQAASYSVLFRLYLCCGLRLSEGVNILRKDVNLENGVLFIKHSKGDKDRKVFMSSDMTKMCQKYDLLVGQFYPDRTFFFVSKNVEKPIFKTTLDFRFKDAWNNSGCAKKGGKNPTVHSLRHTYVVKCINKWFESDVNVESMMPYLSRQLGHASVDGTQYYYHATVASGKILRKKDQLLNKIIPEINNYDEKSSVNHKINPINYCYDFTDEHSIFFADSIIPKVEDYE